MKKKLIIICLVIFSIYACSNSKDTNEKKIEERTNIEKILNGVYEYTYEHNTDELIENHYIQFKDSKVIYYGTSDDFDNAREGYLPGFFNKKIRDFKVTENKLSFSLTVDINDFFERRITPFMKYEHNPNWSIGITNRTREYKGIITENKLIIETKGFDKRVFVRK